MSQIRSFIAIEMSLPVKTKIEDIQNKLKSSASDIRWAKADSIHLTLKFLGTIAEEQIPEISDSIESCCTTSAPFTLTVNTLGAFPGDKNPRVIWIGTEDGTGTLVSLQQCVEKKLSTIGFKEEKRAFSPHLTLGRIKSPKGKRDLMQRVAEHKNCECGTLDVQEICLFKSDLKPGGAVHTKLKTFQLHE